MLLIEPSVHSPHKMGHRQHHWQKKINHRLTIPGPLAGDAFTLADCAAAPALH